MKLFEDINETKTSQMWTYKVDGKDVDKEEIYHKIESVLVPETVDYLLTTGGGSTLRRIRHLIVSLYNYNKFEAVDLFGLMRNADDEHTELVLDIIGHCDLKYGDSCFLMINDLAPKIIDIFFDDDNKNDEEEDFFLQS